MSGFYKRHYKKWVFSTGILLATSFSCFAGNDTDSRQAIENGLLYLESVQTSYGEFPTTFTPNIPEPERSLQANFDSNLFTTAMLADAIHSIKSPRVDRMEKKATDFIKSQLSNKNGLWSYFTSHNAKPLYPTSVYDLDDTVFASMVLQQNNISFPDNRAPIKANKDESGAYLTFFRKDSDIDCGVNANVLSYLKDNDPQVCGYLNEQVARGNNCANYYTLSDAYYLIARAYANGASCLKPSVAQITNYAVKQIDKQKGSVEDSPFKTAIALNTLLSLDYHGPEIQTAKSYLLKSQSQTGSWAADDFWLWTVGDDDGNAVLYGRSSSSALTTALVLKALNAMSSANL